MGNVRSAVLGLYQIYKGKAEPLKLAGDIADEWQAARMSMGLIHGGKVERFRASRLL